MESVTDNLDLDRYHMIVFPNRLRELRRTMGFVKLLALSKRIPDIPYVRLSKIERGEVLPKAEELQKIAAVLGAEPADFLIDIEDPAFDIAAWASDLIDPDEPIAPDDFMAVLVAAAVRERRTSDKSLSIADIERDFGIAPVSLSRIENATKPLGRLNPSLIQKIFKLLDVGNEAELKDRLRADYASGKLTPFLAGIRNALQRQTRTVMHLTMLRDALNAQPASKPDRGMTANGRSGAEPSLPAAARDAIADHTASAVQDSDRVMIRVLPVYGTLLPDGLLARTPVDKTVEAPRSAGPNAWGLQICRPSLGMGLPGRSVVIVDPDRYPIVGSLAVLQEAEGYRILMVATDKDGALHGYSERPALDILLDDIPIGHLSAVVGAIFD